MMRRKNLLLSLSMILMMFGLASNASAEGAERLKDLLESLKAGEPVYYENITIIPIYSMKIIDRTPYVSLEQALKQGWLKIEELEGGTVPQLSITNLSNKTIYIMGGEILSGGKQDRIVGRDLLIEPGIKELPAPVYCVESGRWHYNTSNFYSKQNLGTYKLRSAAQDDPGQAQSSIWNQIAKANQEMGVISKTDAYQEAYEDEGIRVHIGRIELELQNVPSLHEAAIGAIVGLGNKIVSVDIFANPHLFNQMWPKILKSSALAAVCIAEKGSISQAEAVDFLRTLQSKTYTQNPGVDLGVELSSADALFNVNALLYRGAVIHLAGFPRQEAPTSFESGAPAVQQNLDLINQLYQQSPSIAPEEQRQR